MTTEEKTWRLAFVLPNLQLEAAFEFDGLAFVPNNDARLRAMRGTNEAARALLDGFRDMGGGRLRPAAAIYQFPTEIANLWDAIGDARNCLALACVLNGWKISVGELNNFLIRDSDYFDFYRRWPSTDGKNLCYEGPSLGFMGRVPQNFTGQPYPYILPSNPNFSKAEPEGIFDALRAIWRRVHITRRPRAADYRRLRSLSVAYEACRVPHMMENPLYDHGKHCSFWISALETLVHRPRTRVSSKEVLKVLDRRRMRDTHLRRRRRTLMRADAKNPAKRFMYLTLVQRLCKRLYDSRNAFLHGNRLTSKIFIPAGLKEGVRLLDVAPLIYLTALEAELLPQETATVPRRIADLTPKQMRAIFVAAMSRIDSLEDAFKRVARS